jgi:ABC-type dipeptide/oligopeptide/nickel transport system permease subunit
MTRSDPWFVVGLIAFFGLVFFALFGERIAPHEAIYFVPEHGSDPRPYDPGIVFPFGSDVLGRDLFSVVLAGARTTLAIIVLSGAARVVAGALVAAISSWWRPTRFATESLAELAGAVPATLVALVLVKVFLRADPSILVVTGALLVTGWAGPYRVIRAEVDRLGAMGYTQGAIAMGVGRWRLFWRHHLPHIAPVLAVNLSQQIVASLVLVAELGVLSVFIGATRYINLEESLTRVAIREVPAALIADPPEWGGILANARTIESLWTTRWLVLVPGVAFALTAVCVALVGFALTRRYATHDVTQDVRSRGAGALAIGLLAMLVASTFVPERYAEAREWAAAARAEVRPSTEISAVFADAGLKPVGGKYAVQREVNTILQSGPASVKVGAVAATQPWPRQEKQSIQTFVTAKTGGGVVEAPLVFVGRGISPSEHPPAPPTPAFGGKPEDLGLLIKNYADDYAAVDVRGKIVVLVRFLGVGPSPRATATELRNAVGGATVGFPVDDSIASAIAHGAAAVIFVDGDLTQYVERGEQVPARSTAGANPYLRLQTQLPPMSTSGVPVVVVNADIASTLLASTGLDLAPYSRLTPQGTPPWDTYQGAQYGRSVARELGVIARVTVPLARERAVVTSYIGEVGGVPGDSGRVVVWRERRPDEPSSPTRDVLAALARTFSDRRVPFIFVDFDPAVDVKLNAKAVGEALKDRKIALVVVLDRLDGSALRFTTANGELIPALDLYAEKADARFELTRTTATASAASEFAPLIEFKTVIVSGNGGSGDLRADAAAVVGYLAGRLALGAEELPR